MSISKKKQFDLVEKPFDPELIGEWEGKVDFRHIFHLTYIKKNFQKQLHFLPFVDLELFDHYKNEFSRISIYDDNKKKSIHIGDDKKKYIYDNIKHIYIDDIGDKMYYKYISLYKNTKKRFTYFPISLIEGEKNKDDTVGYQYHAISAIYDKKIKEVEIFDSNPMRVNRHETSFKYFFEDIYGKDIKIIYLRKCFSLDLLRSNRCDDIPYKYTSEGFCIIWVLWYLELRLKNRDLSRDQIYDKAVDILKYGGEENTTKVCELLRGYAQFVDKAADKYIIINKNGKNTLVPNPKPKVFTKSVPTTNFSIRPGSIKTNKDYLIALGLLSAIIGIGAAVVALKKYYIKKKNKKI
jgi:hypothetical protein